MITITAKLNINVNFLSRLSITLYKKKNGSPTPFLSLYFLENHYNYNEDFCDDVPG